MVQVAPVTAEKTANQHLQRRATNGYILYRHRRLALDCCLGS